jgi:hypothetical protein
MVILGVAACRAVSLRPISTPLDTPHLMPLHNAATTAPALPKVPSFLFSFIFFRFSSPFIQGRILGCDVGIMLPFLYALIPCILILIRHFAVECLLFKSKVEGSALYA